MDDALQTLGRSPGRDLRIAGVIIVTLLTVLLGARFDVVAAAAMQRDQSSVSIAREDRATELAELGETLKAAVLSGALSEDDAIKIYMSMARSLAPDRAKKSAAAGKGADGPYAAKLDVMMLAAPRPGEYAALFQPEFVRRDLQLLRRELELDRDQTAIVEILLTEYLESFEMVSTPLHEALARYMQTVAREWVTAALDRARVDDAETAVANTREALLRLEVAAEGKVPAGDTGNEEKRAARQAWAQRMVEVAATMDDRLAALRERVQGRIAEMAHAGVAVTADDLVRMARELRGDRTRLRAEFLESLEFVAVIDQTDGERARFQTAVVRVRIEHDLRRGRLGGESMSLWAALDEITRDTETRNGRAEELLEVQALLQEHSPGLAATLDARTEATLDRELRGLEYQADRDRMVAATVAHEHGQDIDASRLTSALRPFADASRREVAASVAVRDDLLALLDASCALLDETEPDASVSMAYRDAALRRGFRTEMRQRWSERALAAALRLDDLADDSRAALATMEHDVAAALRPLRAEAIAERIRRDPERAIERIDAQLETGSPRREKFDLEELLGFDHEVYAALDERTGEQLRAILTPEQLAAVPSRSWASEGGKRKANRK